MPNAEPESLATRLARRIADDGGWWPFDRFMAGALYEPGQGYYARGAPIFGASAERGADFVTAPELSPLFGRALARQVAQALASADAAAVVEFGAGSGALALQLLGSLPATTRYRIVELSAALRERQQARLAGFGARVRWLDTLPERITGVVVGNEVLDAMPVQLLHFDGSAWSERGVALDHGGRFVFVDRPTTLRPPVEAAFVPGTTTELHLQAQAFVRSVAERLERGAAFFVDYGFPAAEYYHPERTGGTLMCHRLQRADADPLVDVGLKDISTHIDFTAIALAAQDAGMDVVGYTSQARFLLNCGLLDELRGADPRTLAAAHKLLAEHEMGELYKVLALARGVEFDPLGFAAGDRTHRL